MGRLLSHKDLQPSRSGRQDGTARTLVSRCPNATQDRGTKVKVAKGLEITTCVLGVLVSQVSQVSQVSRKVCSKCF